MKKLFIALSLLLLVSMPIITNAAILPLVQCGNQADTNGVITNPCTIADFFQMLLRIYKFMLYMIALPLAGLLMVIAGILMIVSGANPNLFNKGKSILWGTGLAIALIFGSWLIINTVFLAIGYRPASGNWWTI